MLGMSSGTKLLIVCHCEREHGEVIRIISARKATKYEGSGLLLTDLIERKSLFNSHIVVMYK